MIAVSDCVMTSEGEVQQCDVTGRLEVRTEGSATSRVDVSLAEDVRLLEPDEPGNSGNWTLTSDGMFFHSGVNCNWCIVRFA